MKLYTALERRQPGPGVEFRPPADKQPRNYDTKCPIYISFPLEFSFALLCCNEVRKYFSMYYDKVTNTLYRLNKVAIKLKLLQIL